MPRRGLSARLRLTLSYAALVVIVGALLLAVVFVYLLRYVPEGNLVVLDPGGGTSFAPDRSDLLRAFVPAATWACVALCTLGMVGGWFLAGHVLRPLAALGDAARKAAAGSLTHRIGATGPRDEFREVADAFDSMLARVERNVDEHRRFAANASHELRTPISALRVEIEDLASWPQTPTDVAAELRSYLPQLDRLNTAVRTYLDRESSQRLTDVESVDLVTLVRSAMQRWQPSLRTLLVAEPEGPMPVRAAPATIGTILDHLLRDAVDRGATQVHVELECTESYGRVRLSLEGEMAPAGEEARAAAAQAALEVDGRVSIVDGHSALLLPRAPQL